MRAGAAQTVSPERVWSQRLEWIAAYVRVAEGCYHIVQYRRGDVVGADGGVRLGASSNSSKPFAG